MNTRQSVFLFPLFFMISLLVPGCANVNMKLFTDSRDPLLEQTLSGSGTGKIAVVPVVGMISDFPEWSLFKTTGSMVQETVSQLDLAAKDPDVKAIVLKINSPGGTVTGSDILYREIENFKEKTKKPVVAVMMDVATSGGYYVALPADCIVAHPTTITGSVGVIFLRPKFYGLMDKIGVEVDVSKSGSNKDMGSPFRAPTPEEEKLFQNLIDRLGTRFFDLVKKHRKLDETQFAQVRTAQIFLSEEARKLGLIDDVGYLDLALNKARELGKLSPDSRVVMYRRSHFPNDNIYNISGSHFEGASFSVIDLGILNRLKNTQPGFYFLWTPGMPY